MRIEDIHWHDSIIRSVELRPEDDSFVLRLSYPVEWETDTYEDRALLFTDVYGYKEFEGPFLGAPTIFEANIVGKNDGWKLLRLDTNAGYRELFFKEVTLVHG